MNKIKLTQIHLNTNKHIKMFFEYKSFNDLCKDFLDSSKLVMIDGKSDDDKDLCGVLRPKMSKILELNYIYNKKLHAIIQLFNGNKVELLFEDIPWNVNNDIGVLLARFQPLHNGHMKIIKDMLDNNKEIYLFIGSANLKHTERNPYDINVRNVLLRMSCIEAFSKDCYKNRISILPLEDLTNENDNNFAWGDYLYNSIVEKIGTDKFDFYSGESMDKLNSWFTNEIKSNINFKLYDRNDGFSATKVRNAIKQKDLHFIYNNCPVAVARFLHFVI